MFIYLLIIFLYIYYITKYSSTLLYIFENVYGFTPGYVLMKFIIQNNTL